MADESAEASEPDESDAPFGGNGYTTWSGEALARALGEGIRHRAENPPIYVANPFTRRALLADVSGIRDQPISRCRCGCPSCCSDEGDAAGETVPA